MVDLAVLTVALVAIVHLIVLLLVAEVPEHQQIRHRVAAPVEVVVVAEMLVLSAVMAVLEQLDKDSQVAAAMLAWVVQIPNTKAVVVVVLVA